MYVFEFQFHRYYFYLFIYLFGFFFYNLPPYGQLRVGFRSFGLSSTLGTSFILISSGKSNITDNGPS